MWLLNEVLAAGTRGKGDFKKLEPNHMQQLWKRHKPSGMWKQYTHTGMWTHNAQILLTKIENKHKCAHNEHICKYTIRQTEHVHQQHTYFWLCCSGLQWKWVCTKQMNQWDHYRGMQRHTHTHTCKKTHTSYPPIRLEKALLTLLLYPAPGATLLPWILSVLTAVGFLWEPSEDEYPELSTLLWVSSLWLGLWCKPGLLELQGPATGHFSGGTEGLSVGVWLRLDDGVRAGRGVATGGRYGTVLMVAWVWLLKGEGVRPERQKGDTNGSSQLWIIK